ncbi:hypothetical protein Sya03_53890 [Spirilliplanes yamanashiensis]|uniref:Uncharacterized protein n=1 Tax=Spirilliplanes yamanashiensis TaxID=42233 RepID=A0A8J3YDY0_9ACTN|nr:hypothetical protein Sya03_53890 [Spirilliplanes yamanashiensis]
MVAAVLAVLAGAGLLAGRWLSPGSPRDQALDRARAAALERAGRAADRVEEGDAREAAQYVHDAAQADGIEVMAVRGADRDRGDGVTLVVRAEGSAGVAGAGGGEVAGRWCFELLFDGTTNDLVQDEVDCPAGPPVTVATDPELPPGVGDELARALPAGEPVTERSLRRAVAGLRLDPRVGREVGTFDGGVVAGVLRATRYRCLMMRVTSDGELQTWVPSRISVAPGESDCTAGSAAGGTGR